MLSMRDAERCILVVISLVLSSYPLCISCYEIISTCPTRSNFRAGFVRRLEMLKPFPVQLCSVEATVAKVGHFVPEAKPDSWDCQVHMYSTKVPF